MRTWRINRVAERCGNCNGNIAVGDKFLELNLATATLVRCQSCGERMTSESAPDVIQEEQDATVTSAPEGIRYQPSLGFGHQR